MKKQILIILILLLQFGIAKSQNLTIDLDNNIVKIQQVNVSFVDKVGSDGIRVSYPSYWNTSSGRDGRIVAYPTGWTYEEGRDGRKVVRPIFGWTWEEGRDGRRVVSPISGWTYEEGRDGRKVVRPISGWTYEEGRDGRIVINPKNTSSGIELVFVHPEYLAMFKELESDMSENELINYILYIWINVDNEE